MYAKRRKQLQPFRSIKAVDKEFRGANLSKLITLSQIVTEIVQAEQRRRCSIDSSSSESNYLSDFKPTIRSSGNGNSSSDEKGTPSSIEVIRSVQRQQKIRIGAPLDISTCDGIELLDAEEVELCSALRLLPEMYQHAKRTLIANYMENPFKKSAAQKMLRIDVNKTGKLYDFFCSRGWIISPV